LSSTFEILIIGNPILRRRAKPVTEFGKDLHEFGLRMLETMLQYEGVGLAAPQVGVSSRVIVLGIPQEDESLDLRIMVNPEVVDAQGEITFEEGCLSIPGIREDVVRPEKVTVRYQETDGTPREIRADGLLARALQHEVDHLDGFAAHRVREHGVQYVFGCADGERDAFAGFSFPIEHRVDEELNEGQTAGVFLRGEEHHVAVVAQVVQTMPDVEAMQPPPDGI